MCHVNDKSGFHNVGIPIDENLEAISSLIIHDFKFLDWWCNLCLMQQPFPGNMFLWECCGTSIWLFSRLQWRQRQTCKILLETFISLENILWLPGYLLCFIYILKKTVQPKLNNQTTPIKQSVKSVSCFWCLLLNSLSDIEELDSGRSSYTGSSSVELVSSVSVKMRSFYYFRHLERALQ